MGLVVNTNVGSLNAQRSLAASSAELKTAMERLSSGSKINSASDDAAGFAIAERMTAQIRGLNMAAKNAGDGLSMLSAIENATNDVTDMLQRMRELAVQAVNDTNTQQDREYLQGEVSALIAEIDRVATQTQYNGQAILDGSMSGKIQVGTEAGQTIDYQIASISKEDLGGAVGAVISGSQQTIDSEGWSLNKLQNGNTSITVTGTAYNQLTADGPLKEGVNIIINDTNYEVSDAQDNGTSVTFSPVNASGLGVVLDQIEVGQADFLYAWGPGTGSQVAIHSNQAIGGYIDAGGLEAGDTLSIGGEEFTLDTFTLYQSGPTATLVNESGGASITDLESHRGDYGMLFMNVNTIQGGGNQVDGYVGPGRSGQVSHSNTLEVIKKLDQTQIIDGDLVDPGNYDLSVDSVSLVLPEIDTVQFESIENLDLVNGASDALATITAAIEQVAGNRAEYGALQNRLEYTVSNLMNVSEFTTAARSRIADADFAAESARLAKAQVLQQSGTAMLAQANASSRLALSLIR